MRPHISMIISLILTFNLLTTQTYGSILGVSELKHAALQFLNQRIMEFEEVVRQEAPCLIQGHQDHCFGNGRKLLMRSPNVVSNIDNKMKREEASPVKRDNTVKPDVLDIAGMDYSPAKRKPPIHN